MTVAALAGRVEFEQGRGAFANAAHELREYGLCPIPVSGEDGKTPCIKWPKLRPSHEYIDKLINRHLAANVGILCGLSEVTVIDIDDPGVASDPQRLEEYKQRFGDTPLIIQTPSGGAHLYYQSSGELNANLRPHDLSVDVKGIGGMVVVPPSIRRTGDHAGNAYDFLVGSWMDLCQLPLLKAGALLFGNSGRGTDQFTGSIDTENRVSKGMRNNALYYFAKDQARYCDNLDDLLDVAKTYNMDFVPRLSNQEVERVARSVWGYYERGELWIPGGPPRVVLTGGERGDYSKLRHNADACLLYVTLKMNHAARAEPFAVPPKEMAAAGVIPAFKKSHDRYRNALRFLLRNDLLEQVHCGKGRIKRDDKLVGDPHSFTFPSTPGPKSGPNITNTPPPWGYGED